jgi:glycosyltransferase involved in cell wall biosynthesis
MTELTFHPIVPLPEICRSEETVERSPKVSVIIPTYNRGKFLSLAIRSVLAQTFSDFEIIVIDDGSTDDTSAIIKTIHDDRLIYIYQVNQGRSNARNHALRLARGGYITFLDSDDLYLPSKLELQVSYLDSHPHVGMIYTSALCINEAGDPLPHKYEAKVSGHIYKDIAFFTPVTITLPTVMARREVFDAVGGFDEEMHRFEDTDMWRRISKSYCIDAIEEYTCELRTHEDNSLVALNPEHIQTSLDHYAGKILREDRETSMAVRRKGLASIYMYYGKALRHVPLWKWKGRALLFTSFCYWPWNFIIAFKARFITPKLKQLTRWLFYRVFCPKVSIVIPVYNGADYLSEAIDSALAQSYKNIEILVINDGSNDDGDTDRIALSYGKKIRYFKKPNGGVASALNQAIVEMTGKYFSWLSHDDLYTKDKVEKEVDALSKIDSDDVIIYSDFSVFTNNPENSVSVRLKGVPPEHFRYWITVDNSLHGCTMLIPRSAFEVCGGFNEILRATQDYDLWFRLAEKFHFVHIPEELVKARSHADQGSNKMGGIALVECNDLLTRFVGSLTPDDIFTASAKKPSEAYSVIAANMHRRGFEQAGRLAEELANVNMRQNDAEEAGIRGSNGEIPLEPSVVGKASIVSR